LLVLMLMLVVIVIRTWSPAYRRRSGLCLLLHGASLQRYSVLADVTPETPLDNLEDLPVPRVFRHAGGVVGRV